ncbi:MULTISPECIES: MFS transporter [unclassified Beijerinckia]|uniref:MFS transporter n=1 Tax=unclassified Beijerinckia TaxID=2638183 RepID=UPI0008942B6E|nr:MULTISPECIES: MFS transporter [unclassified Beijerinckia]MDH7799072.1 benzoate transport [Beijerinckia sp. GAS462]SED96010.1 benzoate transport [Beijerinckia sp. 28-YEA-48]
MSVQTSTSRDGTAGGEDATVDRYARKALIASNVGYAMDGFDLMILSFMLPAVVAGLHLTGSEAGSLITWTLIGAVVGGLVVGTLSDKFGRIRVLSWTILLFAIFTGLCAFAQGYWDLLIYRTIAGIGLGGEFGIGMALVAEAWPAHKRARASSYVALGWQAGVLSAALLTPLLLPIIGWRGMFLVGLIPAIIAFALRRYLHEPELFVKAAKAEKERSTNPYSYFFANREATRSTIGIGIMTSVQNFGYYGMMIWLPSYLSTQLGFSLTRSALWTSVTVIGGAVGMWVFGQLADRIGRKPLFIAFQVGAMVMAFIYPQIKDPTLLLIAGGVTGIFLSGMIGGYGALISESYPTQARATAQNVLFNIGRGIGGFGPLVIGVLATQYSLSVALSLLVFVWALDIVATIFLIKERKGEELV